MERKAVREMELKARELDLEAELRREEMKFQKAAQPNIEEAQDVSRIEWGGFLMSVRNRRCLPRDYLRTFYHRRVVVWR